MSVSNRFAFGLGWVRDLPDPRDYTPDHETIRPQLEELPRRRAPRNSLPRAIDLRCDEDGLELFSQVDDQGAINCSTACAILGLLEYFERRTLGHTLEASVLYLYKMARRLRRSQGDSGADLRTTLRALIRFGLPPVDLWFDEPNEFDEEKSDFAPIGFFRDYETVQYCRLDARNQTGYQTLQTLKAFLAARFPVAFGFPVPRSVSSDPDIPYRPTFDSIRGGQSVVAVGYDDRHITSTPGALRIRNSWGSSWGEKGYGWLPYEYVTQQLAGDFWTILRKDWLASGELLRPKAIST